MHHPANDRYVPITDPHHALLSVSYGENRRSDSVGQGLLCAQSGLLLSHIFVPVLGLLILDIPNKLFSGISESD